MTHDELLAKIYDSTNGLKYEDIFILLIENTNALRAVVELHKPDKEGLCAMNCVEVDDDGYAWTQVAYPCLTIQTIEKELK